MPQTIALMPVSLTSRSPSFFQPTVADETATLFEHCARGLDQSLARMGLEYVDIFYSHRFDPDTPLEETMGALDTAVRQGKALYAGISSYSLEKTREAAATLAARFPSVSSFDSSGYRSRRNAPRARPCPSRCGSRGSSRNC